MRTFASSAVALAIAGLLSSAARADDTEAPVIEHKPVASTPAGAPLKVTAKITDASKFFPQVFYRSGGGAYAKPVDMKPVGGQKSMFEARVPVPASGSVEYYLEAYDEYGNGPARAGDPDHPLRVAVEAQAVASADPTPAPAPRAAPPPPASSTASAPPPTTVASATPPPSSSSSSSSSARRGGMSASSSHASGGRTWTWVVGGVGLGMLTGGIMAGLAKGSADDAYAARLKDPQNNPATLQQQYDSVSSIGSKATILLIGGGVLLATGVVLYFVEAPKSSGAMSADATQPAPEEKKFAIAAAPVNGGGAVVAAGHF